MASEDTEQRILQAALTVMTSLRPEVAGQVARISAPSVAAPSLGVTCLDCHANFHSNAAFHQTPDVRPQAARFRLEKRSMDLPESDASAGIDEKHRVGEESVHAMRGAR